MVGRMSRIGSWVTGAVAVGAIALVPAAASAQTPTPAPAAGTVGVEAVDFGFKPATQTVAPGAVNFAFQNTGTRPHELVVVKSDLAPRALPLKDGRVDETAIQIISHMARVAPPAATTGALSVNLAEGRYLVICNIATHYASGMTFSLVVGNAGTPAALVPPSATAVPAPTPAAGATAAPGAASPAPARTGNGGPMTAETESTTGALALATLALAFVAGARAWTGHKAR